MELEYLTQVYSSYKSKPVNMTIHPDDGMYLGAAKPEDYKLVGEASIRSIFTMLAAQNLLYNVHSILDFGCGHGRVGRHLRAFFPKAEITFSDVDPSCTNFCAATFGGIPLVTPKSFDELDIEGRYDLIWLGSVFTHIDYARMQVLFGKLFNLLKPNGLLVGTFRGQKMHDTYKHAPLASERDAGLLAEYEAKGYGYKRYKNWKDDWGLSLVSREKLVTLGSAHETARIVAFTEVGWASAHDVIGWTNASPRIAIS